MSAYDFTCDTLTGERFPLRDLAGKPLLIVNTASKCGFTPQYAGLEALWQQYRTQGLTIIGVPSNDFGAQEPGSSSDIIRFCQTNYGVTFPIMAKTPVSGPDIHPLFRWLADEAGWLGKPRWNFFKYLIGRDGHLQSWFSSLTPPDAPRFQRAVETAIGSAAKPSAVAT